MGIDRGQGTPVSSNPLELDNDDYSSTVVGPRGPKGDDGDITPEYTQMYNDTIAAKNTATSKASEASASASNASTSETNANTSANAASASATSASNSASASATSETNAATSESNAASSATAAASSATSASGSASTATTKASEAATSASTATTKASEAATSASTATTKASEAATSATNAASSESAASTSATNAANSATASASSASNASTSETNAASSATSAATSATNAAASESSVATNASNAATSETNAANSATSASTSASTATTKASEAATSASTATTKASEASTSASNAATSATSAATSATNAAASFDSFDDRYLGSKSSEPTVDNDGDALLTGALYFNSTTNTMKVYSGSSWLDAYATLSGALLATNNLSDLNNAATARTNLGLGTAATTASTDYATSAQGTTADNALPKAGGTMTGDIAHGDNVRAKFGASDDLQIFHDGSNSYIKDSGTGDLKLQGNNLTIGNTADTKYFTAVNGGKTAIYHQGNEKLATTSTGVDVTGTVTADGAIYLDGGTGYGQVEVGGDSGGYIDIKKPNSDDYDARLIYSGSNFDIHTNADEPIRLRHNNSTKLATTSTGVDVSGTVIADDATLQSGSPTFKMVSPNGSNGYQLFSNVSDTVDGGLKIQDVSQSNADRLYIAHNGDINFYEDTGTTPKLTWDASAESLKFADNGKATFGASDDLQIYHDGTNSWIRDTGSGSLIIRGQDFVRISGETSGYTLADFVGSTGESKLFHQSNLKLKTTSTGVDVTGTVTADGLTVDPVSTPVITLKDVTGTNGYIIRSSVTSSTDYGLRFRDLSNKELMQINSNGDISFYEDTGTTPKFFWDASAERLGIGTTSPNYLLDAEGASGSISALRVANPDVGLRMSAYTNAYGEIRVETNHPLLFKTNGNNERMRINADGRVGIGTSSPIRALDVRGGTTDIVANFESSDSGAYIALQDNATSSDTSVLVGAVGNALRIDTGDTESLRIDSSGNVLVGKTSTSSTTVGAEIRPEGRIFGTTNSQFALLLNRTSTDGDIAVFRKDGSTVGSAATYSGTVQFGQGNANLKFSNASDAITPANGNGTNNNNALDLGSTAANFKDGHFSGTVNANAFVGDGSGLTGISGGGSTGPAFFAKKHATGSGPPQYVTTNTYTKVTFTVEDIDTDSDFTSSRFTPQTAGYYWIHVNLLCTLGTGFLKAAIYKNGSLQIESSYYEEESYSAKGTASGLVYLNGSTDYVEAYVLLQNAHSTAGSASVQLNRSSYFTGFLAR